MSTTTANEQMITDEEWELIKNSIEKLSEKIKIDVLDDYTNIRWKIIFGVDQKFIKDAGERKNITGSDLKIITVFDNNTEIQPELLAVSLHRHTDDSKGIQVCNLQKQIWSLFLKILREEMCIPMIVHVNSDKITSKEGVTAELIAAGLRSATNEQMEASALL